MTETKKQMVRNNEKTCYSMAIKEMEIYERYSKIFRVSFLSRRGISVLVLLFFISTSYIMSSDLALTYLSNP